MGKTLEKIGKRLKTSSQQPWQHIKSPRASSLNFHL